MRIHLLGLYGCLDQSWWYFFGPISKIFPEQVHQGFAQFNKHFNSQESPILADLKYFSCFTLSWIFSWQYRYSKTENNKQFPSLQRHGFVKWWNQFDTSKAQPDKFKAHLEFLKAPDQETSFFAITPKPRRREFQSQEEGSSSSKKEDTNSSNHDNDFYQNEDDCFGNWLCNSDLVRPIGIERVLTEKDLLADSYSDLEASILDEKEFLLLKFERIPTSPSGSENSKQYPPLQRHAFVKWWSQFDTSKAAPEQVKNWFQSNPKFLKPADPETSLFLNQKSQLAAFMASSKSKESLAQNLKEEEEEEPPKKEAESSENNDDQEDDPFYQNEDDCFGISLDDD
ncbi:hypothetical protein GmHk_15G044496 [Glycine max]|nr:hypothetical protein GmHk_15G044496 [Glycine max]